MRRAVPRAGLPLLPTAALAGCANEEAPRPDPFAKVERPSQPRPCPMPFDGADQRRFDARALLGLREQDAREQAARFKCEIRVVRRDERHLPITGDWRADRVDVALEDGVVVALPDAGWTSYAPLPQGAP